VFRTLDTAFSEIYGNDTPPGLAAQFKNGAVVFGAMTTAVVAIVAGGSVAASSRRCRRSPFPSSRCTWSSRTCR
jgi:hypothetical protein